MAFLRLVGSLLESLLQLIQFLAQLGERLFRGIGFVTSLLGGAGFSFCRPIFLVLATIF